MFANLIVGSIAAFYLLAFLSCAIYCRIQKRRNRRKSELSNQMPVSKECGEPNSKRASHELKNRITPLVKSIDPYIYGLTRYLTIVVGRIPSCHIRKVLMKYVFCMDISKDAVLYGGYEIRSPWNVHIGRAVIGVGALIDGRAGVVIEDDVVLASGVNIYTMQHDVDDSMFRVNEKSGGVLIHRHAWISSHSTVLPKVEIGEGAVLSAGAIATKSLDAFGIYSGIPATKKRERNHELEYISGKTYWHFY